MPNELTKTDRFVREQLEKYLSNFTEKGTDNIEIRRGLKGASKQKNQVGNGYPDFITFSNGCPIIIENKLDNKKIEKFSENGLDESREAVINYAVNGAVHYASHIVFNTTVFKEVIAIGVTGNKNNHIIQPYRVFLDEVGNVKNTKLPELFSLEELAEENFNEWYNVNVLGELSQATKEIIELQNVASELHEDLRNYGNLEGENKATVVSAILLALKGDPMLISQLKGTDNPKTRDGVKVFNAIEAYLIEVKPEVNNFSWSEKIEILMNKFSFLKTSPYLNTVHKKLGVTPLKYFTEKLDQKVIHHIVANNEFDILGNFYGEFVKYGGNDGNSLGIVLTPMHITSLMVELIDINSKDKVLDPACGSAGFLISAMNKMLDDAVTEQEKQNIRQNQLFGIELQEKLFTVATTNMILRGDGKSNLQLADMFTIKGNAMREKGITKVLFNPPYSQAKSKDLHYLSELSFIQHALEMLEKGGKLAVIVPQSTMVGKTKKDKEKKQAILQGNTLDSVITLNKDTFYGVGVNPCIVIFTAGKPHPINKQVLFVNFVDDGYSVKKHIGLVPDGSAKIKRSKLINLVRSNYFELDNKFYVRSTITAEDEWLYSYFYSNNEIPSSKEFEKTVQDYLAFKFDQIIHGKEYLFNDELDVMKKINSNFPQLEEVEWGVFDLKELFNISTGASIPQKEFFEGNIPRITATSQSNGIGLFTNKIRNKNYRTKKNCITYSFLGDVFYHPYNMSADMKIHIITTKQLSLNKYIGLFIVQCLRKLSVNLSYGNQMSMNDLKQKQITLPKLPNGNPDWEYMEQYVVNKMNDILSKMERIFY
ncbi:N-6 DNA methylase [Enterococcus sp. AZ152]|uniref:N-6 DNA methylase n=1 Tax=Enterococcus sp. AZ152 TaxID=2774848 RepID=UPI003F1F9374